MRAFYKRLTLIQLVLISLIAQANDSLSVHFLFDKTRTNDSQVVVKIKAYVPNGIKLYALQKSSDDAVYSSIEFDSSCLKYLEGPVRENGAVKKENDNTLSASVNYITDSVTWGQLLNVGPDDSLLL